MFEIDYTKSEMYTQVAMNKQVLEIVRIWLPLALISTIICALIYLTLQQHMRQGANDPQIQLSEDRALMLSQGEAIHEVIPSTIIDISKSLAPFFIAFNLQGEVIASSGQLNGKTPTPPSGVFEYIKVHGQNRFTWQPTDTVRIAAVITPFKGAKPGYLLVGRSLREVEKREYQLTLEVFGAWMASLILSLFAVTFLNVIHPKK